MHLVKIINANRQKILLVLGFTLLFFLTRLPGLKTDTINPDAVNWHYRSQQFIVGIKSGNFEKTYQHYHPGVTIMWITGVPIEIYKQLTGIQFYDHMNFLEFHFIAKLFLVISQLTLSYLIIYYLSKAVGFRNSLFVVLVLSLEPFFIGISRLYHMDAIFTLLVFLDLIFMMLYWRSEEFRYVIFIGIVCGLVFLTRSLGIGIFLYFLGLVFIKIIIKYKEEGLYITKYLKHSAVMILVFVFTTFILFPALWVRPAYYLTEIFSEGERVGVRKGHEQVYFGELTNDPGPLFYPLIILIKFSPFILLGSIFGFRDFRKKPHLLILLGFYIGYFIVMTLPTKKIDRYMVTLFPLFALLAIEGYEYLQKRVQKKLYKPLIGLLFGIFVLIPVFSVYPYYFTYASPLFATTSSANHIIGQKSFGVGVYSLKEYILENYGSDVVMGFIDTKPMKSIYPNSLIYDIRVSGFEDSNVIIVGINEVIPEDIQADFANLELDSVYYINGLEYWRIYVKKEN